MKQMRMRHWLWATWWLVLFLAFPIAAADKAIGLAEAVRHLPDTLLTPHRYALVIGVGQYQDKRIPQLPACSNDARSLYELLVDPSVGMFASEDVIFLVDAEVTRIRVVEALDQLARKAGKDDLVVVFFSGHGAVDEQGRSYWVMGNTRIDSLRATAFSETEITELLGEIKTTRLVTLIDACYSAATAKLGQSKSLLDLKQIYPKFTGQGRVAITASKGDQLSVVIQDKNNPGYGHSAFTWQVLEAIQGQGDTDGDGVVTVDELWDYVKDRTATTARQQGGNQQPQLKGQIGSKFLLTVDRERLIRRTQEAQSNLSRLKNLFLQDKINAETYQEASRLLGTADGKLDFMQQKRKGVYSDLAKGDLKPRYLQAALDAIETPAQRAARLEREAREQAQWEKEQKISQLWATAKANDNKTNGHQALDALEELLKLDSANANAEALALRVKIQGYYGPSPGEVMTNSMGMKLVWVPAGEFMMGSPSSESGRYIDEGPQHRVKLTQGFWMGVYEVTQAQYQAVMGTNPSHFKGNDLPVETVSWNGAVEFCKKLSRIEGKTYRLPTEAEWEYAARGGSQSHGTIYAGSSNIDEVAWYSVNSTIAKGFLGFGSHGATHPVGQKQGNELGLYDMTGNVWEWCQDRYKEDYYAQSPLEDPLGPDSGSNRVLRGGSWYRNPGYCRAADRFRDAPDGTHIDIGFRVLCVSED